MVYFFLGRAPSLSISSRPLTQKDSGTLTHDGLSWLPGVHTV